jgi:hypothetical protein
VSARSTIPAAELASIIPAGPAPRAALMVEANAMLGVIVLHFAAGPQGKASNIKSEIALDPADAERLARQILDDLDGFPERCATVAAALAGGTP